MPNDRLHFKNLHLVNQINPYKQISNIQFDYKTQNCQWDCCRGEKLASSSNQWQQEIRKLGIFNHQSDRCHGRATNGGAVKALRSPDKTANVIIKRFCFILIFQELFCCLNRCWRFDRCVIFCTVCGVVVVHQWAPGAPRITLDQFFARVSLSYRALRSNLQCHKVYLQSLVLKLVSPNALSKCISVTSYFVQWQITATVALCSILNIYITSFLQFELNISLLRLNICCST